jgi:formylglycine-generating enzyme required for sulfatase activity
VVTAAPVFPPRSPLAQWREPIPDLPEAAWPYMVTIPAGRFLMGASEEEEATDSDERPQREVTVARPFALGRCAVTFAQWDAAKAAGAGLWNPNDQGWGRGGRPVIDVSWEDAQAYCTWLNRALGLPSGTYRLPTEAEWEYACHAGTTGPFSFGGTISTDQVNYDGNYFYGEGVKGEFRERTVPVGSLPANGWGLHEMHGNVWEWVEDTFGPYPERATDSRALEYSGSVHRILRGGSWNNDPIYCRAAFRGRDMPDLRIDGAGFRLGRTLS